MTCGEATCTTTHPTPGRPQPTGPERGDTGAGRVTGALARPRPAILRRPRGAGRSALADDEAHRLLAGGDVGAEQPAHGGGDGRGPRLADAPHRHAEVLGLDHDHHALRAQPRVDL